MLKNLLDLYFKFYRLLAGRGMGYRRQSQWTSRQNDCKRSEPGFEAPRAALSSLQCCMIRRDDWLMIPLIQRWIELLVRSGLRYRLRKRFQRAGLLQD